MAVTAFLLLSFYLFPPFIPPSPSLLVCAMLCKSLQSCPTLCDPVDCSPPGSSVHRILHARILEQAAIPSSRGSSWSRDVAPKKMQLFKLSNYLLQFPQAKHRTAMINEFTWKGRNSQWYLSNFLYNLKVYRPLWILDLSPIKWIE